MKIFLREFCNDLCIDFLIKPIYRVCYYSEMCYIVVLYGIIDCCCLYLSCSTRRIVFLCKILVKDTPSLCVEVRDP